VSSSLNKFGLEYGAHLDNKSLEKYNFFEEATSDDEDTKHRYYQELAKKLIGLRVLTRGKLEDLGLKEVADELANEGKLS